MKLWTFYMYLLLLPGLFVIVFRVFLISCGRIFLPDVILPPSGKFEWSVFCFVIVRRNNTSPTPYQINCTRTLTQTHKAHVVRHMGGIRGRWGRKEDQIYDLLRRLFGPGAPCHRVYYSPPALYLPPPPQQRVLSLQMDHFGGIKKHVLFLLQSPVETRVGTYGEEDTF